MWRISSTGDRASRRLLALQEFAGEIIPSVLWARVPLLFEVFSFRNGRVDRSAKFEVPEVASFEESLDHI